MEREESRIQPSSDLNSGDSRSEDPADTALTGTTRPLFALFVLPIVILSLGLCIGYIRHFLLFRVRNMIRMVDNYMLSTEDVDDDQTPVKVLDNLDAMTTFDYNSDNDLPWDDSI